MRKANARAKIAPAPDATLLALVEECLEVEARHKAAGKRLEIAHDQRSHVETPPEVLRTEKDLQLNLFVGSPLGGPYSEEEIKAIRIFCRSQEHVNIQCHDQLDAYFRAVTILRAWANWQDALRKEDVRSGYAEAEAADYAIADEHDALLSQIALMRPTSIDGLFAKAKAARWVMPGRNDAEFAKMDDEHLARSLREFGPDQDAMRVSLVRDLLNLASRRA